MQTPDGLTSLLDDGIIERIVRPLMSGKEAQVYLVESRGTLCVAKVYKEAHNRSFKNRAEYTEGRRTRNSRDQRAIDKRTKHGREQDESAWRSTEVDIIRRLHAAGVRVPTPLAFMDGVLVMECVTDAEGNPAPRLSELSFDPATAQAMFDGVIREVVRMLSIGVVHGDLSEFNVLIGRDGPVIIDFPQSVDTASNTNSRRLLLRDVDNFHRFLSRFVPNARRLPLAEEMWDLHENNALTADTRLTGRFRSQQRRSSGESVLDLIQDADRDERRRRDALGLRGGPQAQPQGSYQRGGGQGGQGGYGQGGNGGQSQDRRPPQSGDRPQYNGDRPQNQNSRPPYNGDRPQNQDRRPPHSGDRPQYSADRPQNQDRRPPYNGDRPQNQDRRPPHSGDRPQYSADRPQNQDRRPPYNGDRPQNQNSRPPHSGDRPQYSADRPQNQDRRPPHNGDRPQYSADRPQNQDRRTPYGGDRGPQGNQGQRPPHPNGDGRRPQNSGRGRQGPRPGGNPQQGDQASRGGDGRRPEPKQPRMPEVIVVRTRRSTEPS